MHAAQIFAAYLEHTKANNTDCRVDVYDRTIRWHIILPVLLYLLLFYYCLYYYIYHYYYVIAYTLAEFKSVLCI